VIKHHPQISANAKICVGHQLCYTQAERLGSSMIDFTHTRGSYPPNTINTSIIRQRSLVKVLSITTVPWRFALCKQKMEIEDVGYYKLHNPGSFRHRYPMIFKMNQWFCRLHSTVLMVMLSMVFPAKWRSTLLGLLCVVWDSSVVVAHAATGIIAFIIYLTHCSSGRIIYYWLFSYNVIYSCSGCEKVVNFVVLKRQNCSKYGWRS